MYFTQCSYKGQRSKNGKEMHGFGCYRFSITSTASLRSITSAAKNPSVDARTIKPSGAESTQTTCYYCGSFKNGNFDGPGILFFGGESGGGQYRGYWRAGELVHEMPAASGPTSTGADGEPKTFFENSYVFSDGLRMVFPKESWSYGVEGEDRRFWVEYLEGLLPTMPDETRLGGQRALEILQNSRFAKPPAAAADIRDEASDKSHLVHIGPKSKVLRSVAVQSEILPGERLVERYGIPLNGQDDHEDNSTAAVQEEAATAEESSPKKELQVPEAFRDNRPRSVQDVPNSLWSEPPATKPESEFLAMVLEDLARETERNAPRDSAASNGSTSVSGKQASKIGKELSKREATAAHQVDEKMNMTADVATMVSHLLSQ